MDQGAAAGGGAPTNDGIAILPPTRSTTLRAALRAVLGRGPVGRPTPTRRFGAPEVSVPSQVPGIVLRRIPGIKGA
ncbi:MAG: hypothetical protein ACRDQU_16435 [Pseudonocardiaceae bacterium]